MFLAGRKHGIAIRDVGLRTIVAKRQPAIPLIRVLRDQTLHAWPLTEHTDEKRRTIGPLATRQQACFFHGVVLAFESYGLSLHHGLDDLQGLLEASDAAFPGITEHDVLGRKVAAAYAEDQTAVGEGVDGFGHARQQCWVSVTRVRHQGADLDPLCCHGYGAGSGPALPGTKDQIFVLLGHRDTQLFLIVVGPVAEMIDDPDRVIAELLGKLRETDNILRTRRLTGHMLCFMWQTQTELHSSSSSEHSLTHTRPTQRICTAR